MTDSSFQSALDETKEIELITTGRKTGRQTSRPVWFVREGQALYLLPVTGTQSQWYKNVVRTPAIGLTARKVPFSATATPVTDATTVAHVLDEFRSKYGANDIAAYYSHPDVAVEVPLA
jgi:deazaflavin-dependent oxidoreductase (nitroreductase family)